MAPQPATDHLRDQLDELISELRCEFGDAAVERQLDDLTRHGSNVEEPDIWLPEALRGDFKFTPIEYVERCLCGSSRSTLVNRSSPTSSGFSAATPAVACSM